MQKGFFIQSNKKQFLGALLAKYAFEKSYQGSEKIPVTILLVEEIPILKEFEGIKYLRNGQLLQMNKEDLQSFTLTRFMPPELMNYEGRAVVIDPDIFALKDTSPLFEMDLSGNSLAACRKKGAWDSSVMVLDCTKLKHWKIRDWLEKLANKSLDYEKVMTLKVEKTILEIERKWNSLDFLDENTFMLHTTNRLTQPWKTGLPIDFRRNPLPKIFGIIPREFVHSLLGKRPKTYQQHPNKNIEDLFFRLVKNALNDGAISKDFIEKEISLDHVRKDLLQKITV